MKRFLFVLLFSLLIPIQNSSAVSPSLDETIDFLINGDNNASWVSLKTKEDWSIDNKCILIMKGQGWSGNIETQTYDLNKVIVSTIKPTRFNDGKDFAGKCKGNCRSDTNNTRSYIKTSWWVSNGISWKRNAVALTHLYSNFCTGLKSAF